MSEPKGMKIVISVNNFQTEICSKGQIRVIDKVLLMKMF